MMKRWFPVLLVLLVGGVFVFGLTGCSGAKYAVDYNGHKDAFRGAKDSYRAGAHVKLCYDLIATDTDYSFYLDGEALNPKYDEKKGFVLTFTMPAHDVTVEVRSVNSMVYMPFDDTEDAVLTLDSFDGGGPVYSVTVEDPTVVTFDCDKQYGNPKHEEMDGAAYTVRYTFIGLKPGATTAVLSARSPIADNYDAVYAVTVDEALRVTLTETARTDL